MVRCTLRLEQLGGTFKNDGERRSPGGTFFSLCKGALNRRQRRAVWPTKTEPAEDESAGSIQFSGLGAGMEKTNTSIIRAPSTAVKMAKERACTPSPSHRPQS